MVALNAASVAFGMLSINPMVSAKRILGLFSILPTVVSSVENNWSSTSTVLPDKCWNSDDFPALV